MLAKIKNKENDEEYRKLSASEEYAMIYDNLENPEKIKEELIKRNIALVIPEIRKYKNQVDPDDLFQSGLVGLSKAVDKFDLYAGNKFSTYAYWWIKKCVYECYTAHNKQFDGMTNGCVTSMDMALSDDSGASFADIISDQIVDVDDRLNKNPYIDTATQDDDIFNKKLVDELLNSGIINNNEHHVITSIYFDDIPRKHIATNMGVTTTMIGNHHKSALRKFKRHLSLNYQTKSMKDIKNV